MKLDIKNIEKSLREKSPKPLGIEQRSAVLLPLIYTEDCWHILFQLRSEELSTQPGEVSFPGGDIKSGEKREEAALRETQEELGTGTDEIDLLGEMDYLVTPYNLIIYAFVARMHVSSPEDLQYNSAEVKEVFSAPVKFFRDNPPECSTVRVQSEPTGEFPYNLITGGRDYNWRQGKYPVYFYQYDDYVIWGFTARFVRAFLKLVK